MYKKKQTRLFGMPVAPRFHLITSSMWQQFHPVFFLTPTSVRRFFLLSAMETIARNLYLYSYTWL